MQLQLRIAFFSPDLQHLHTKSFQHRHTAMLYLSLDSMFVPDGNMFAQLVLPLRFEISRSQFELHDFFHRCCGNEVL